jgi:nitrite reductase (NADH) large subunit
MKNKTDIICHCEGITYGQILDAINKGYKTIEELSEHLNVAIACGYCIEDLEEIIEEI